MDPPNVARSVSDLLGGRIDDNFLGIDATMSPPLSPQETLGWPSQYWWRESDAIVRAALRPPWADRRRSPS
jgi:hypothetical protein